MCYYLLVTILFCIFKISALYGICNYLGIAGLTSFYRGTWKKRIWVSLVVFATDLACTLAVYFAFSHQLIVNLQAVQTLLLLTCVTIISCTSDTAADGEIAFDKRQTGILIGNPGGRHTYFMCFVVWGISGYGGNADLCFHTHNQP